MALVPYTFEVDDILEQEVAEEMLTIEPTLTWKLDFEGGRISGFTDGGAAKRQYIRKALITVRNRYLIYNDYYGSEIMSLFGQPITQSLMQVEIPRMITEALLYDDRVVSVEDISISQITSDGVQGTVTVVFNDGETITEEVTL